MKQSRARVTGIGSYLPEKVLSNADLEKIVETSDEWIFTRTGMKERRIAAEGEYTSDLGVQAAKQAMEQAGVGPEDVDFVLFATATPDRLLPGASSFLQAKLGLTRAGAIDVQAACTGYLYGLSMAKAFIESGTYKNILLIAADRLSSFIDYEDRATCVLFGDGAGASVISAEGPGYEIGRVCLGADGEQADLITVLAGGSAAPPTQKTLHERLHYIRMNGREVFKHAVRRMERTSQEALEAEGLTGDDISWMIPHQANFRIIESLAKRFGIPLEKVYMTIHKYGNTSASSVAIALNELLNEKAGKIVDGNRLLLTAFGAGLTYGSTVLTKVSA